MEHQNTSFKIILAYIISFTIIMLMLYCATKDSISIQLNNEVVELDKITTL